MAHFMSVCDKYQLTMVSWVGFIVFFPQSKPSTTWYHNDNYLGQEHIYPHAYFSLNATFSSLQYNHKALT